MRDCCRTCWWREGSRCYNEKIATVTVENGFRQGQVIDQNLRDECSAFHGYTNKRAVYERVIPPERLVFVSERKPS